MAMRTIVLQSQRPGTLPRWQRRCCDSVRAWAKFHSYEYAFCGDELFRRLPAQLRSKLLEQRIVATDLARLLWIREHHNAGYDRAIWCDADLLVFDDFEPAHNDHSFGREIWVQGREQGIHSYRRIHNAWLMFDANSPILAFYIDRAISMLTRVQLPVVPQFIGPKLLSALHNIVSFNIEERVGMLSPLVIRDLVNGGGPALEEMRQGHADMPCAANLCASYIGKDSDGVRHNDDDYLAATKALFRGALAQ
ncbi:MAG: hypothetical protein Cons2KO_25860 [Congregibacter sp.]